MFCTNNVLKRWHSDASSLLLNTEADLIVSTDHNASIKLHMHIRQTSLSALNNTWLLLPVTVNNDPITSSRIYCYTGDEMIFALATYLDSVIFKDDADVAFVSGLHLNLPELFLLFPTHRMTLGVFLLMVSCSETP